MRWDDLFPFLAAGPPERAPWAASEVSEAELEERADVVATSLLGQSFAIASLAPPFASIDGPLADLLDHGDGQVLARHGIVLRSDLAPLSFTSIATLEHVGPARLRAVARAVVQGTLEHRADPAGWLVAASSSAVSPSSGPPRPPTAPLQPYAAAAAELLNRLSDRQRHVFAARHLTRAPATLSRLGVELGVTRERARQILLDAEARVDAELRAPELALVRHDAQALHASLGPAFPDAGGEIDADLAAILETDEEELVQLALFIAGPYALIDGWWLDDPGLSPGHGRGDDEADEAASMVHRRFRARWLEERRRATGANEA
jgi:Sigma-70, region 4